MVSLMSRLGINSLLSLPAASAGAFRDIQPDRAGQVFARSDPPARQLGSGGGTAYLLHQAWLAATADAAGKAQSFEDWLGHHRQLLIHGSGESRRLPAYAALGKPLLPVPLISGIYGQRADQLLLDLQLGSYEGLFRHAPSRYLMMISCGDVLIRYARWLPAYPEADLLIVGLTASPEEASQHGVMVCPADDPHRLCFFLQKPTPDRLRAIGRSRVSYLDTGVWLLSERATGVLMRKCGWDPARQAFENGLPDTYDLYATFGPALGESPVAPDADISALSCAVLPLADGRFYHFGTNRSLLASVSQLQRPAAERRSFGHASMDARIPPLIQHSTVGCSLRPEHSNIWIDSACIPAGWELAERHVLTGVPDNDWRLALPPGLCLDFAPVGADGAGLRFYGFDDAFRGRLDAGDTPWLDRPAAEWFRARGIAWDEAGLDPCADLQDARLFPVLGAGDFTGRFIAWLVAASPGPDADSRRKWLAARRVSARELLVETNMARLAAQRTAHVRRTCSELAGESWPELCVRLDLAATAALCAPEGSGWPSLHEEHHPAGPWLAHDRMFRSALARARQAPEADRFEAEAFDVLRRLIVEQMEAEPVQPARNVLEDQIVWGRAPVRLDLAGGWTDTPPYCLEHGGQVVNIAVDLNGQPPIQVFARSSGKPGIVVNSIDLGISETVSTYEELDQYGRIGSGFGIAKAALALCGFEPRFHARGGYASLDEQLRREFGGGIEMSMLAAVPKGSGLGTSSILAATLLGTLGELLGLHWSTDDLFFRTLALEQMLTSRGGWQDQAGGITPALKLIETTPGLRQVPVIRWLPAGFFGPGYANRQVLLYYTGLTRVAFGILGEIVRGHFLNSGRHVGLIEDIGRNALFAADAVQRNDWPGLCEAVRRSWELNQSVDSGTNPPEVQCILDRIAGGMAACKLLGAGGGGYLLILAEDAEAGDRIRRTLTRNPPNPRARFVDLNVSEVGLQVTRS